MFHFMMINKKIDMLLEKWALGSKNDKVFFN